MILKLPKNELFKYIYDKLTAVNVPVFTEIARPTGAQWVVISQYTHVDRGYKTRNGYFISFLIDVVTKSDNSFDNANLAEQVMEAMHDTKAPVFDLTTFYCSVVNQPTVTTLVEQTDKGLTFRTLLRYEIFCEQK